MAGEHQGTAPGSGLRCATTQPTEPASQPGSHTGRQPHLCDKGGYRGEAAAEARLYRGEPQHAPVSGCLVPPLQYALQAVGSGVCVAWRSVGDWQRPPWRGRAGGGAHGGRTAGDRLRSAAAAAAAPPCVQSLVCLRQAHTRRQAHTHPDARPTTTPPHHHHHTAHTCSAQSMVTPSMLAAKVPAGSQSQLPRSL